MYDLVEEDEYAGIVAKRRDEGGEQHVFQLVVMLSWQLSAKSLQISSILLNKRGLKSYTCIGHRPLMMKMSTGCLSGAGDFIVDDDGMGYADYGEDDWAREENGDAAEQRSSPEQGKKRKKPAKEDKAGGCT